MSSSRFGSPLSIHSRVSRRSSTRSHRSGSRHQRPPSASSIASRKANTNVMPELETARRVAADREANWPELLCGLAYNNTTKRLNISVLRANRLKIPEGSFRSPSKWSHKFRYFKSVVVAHDLRFLMLTEMSTVLSNNP